jgi:hypothetical protein
VEADVDITTRTVTPATDASRPLFHLDVTATDIHERPDDRLGDEGRDGTAANERALFMDGSLSSRRT